MKTLNHPVTIQEFTRLKVIKMLGITEQAYGELVVNAAYAYLHQQLAGAIMGRELETSSLFWAWWRNHWHAVDIDFVSEAARMTIDERNMYYSLVHETLEYRPQQSILADAFKNVNPLIKHKL